MSDTCMAAENVQRNLGVNKVSPLHLTLPIRASVRATNLLSTRRLLARSVACTPDNSVEIGILGFMLRLLLHSGDEAADY